LLAQTRKTKEGKRSGRSVQKGKLSRKATSLQTSDSCLGQGVRRDMAELIKTLHHKQRWPEENGRKYREYPPTVWR